MRIGFRRILIVAIATEVQAVLVLVLLVELWGPSESTAARAFAERLGFWVGPIAGFVFCLVGGFWVARTLPGSHVMNGVVLGLVAAGIDIGILIVSGATFQPVFAVSNVGRVIAGSVGGWVAGWRRRIES